MSIEISRTLRKWSTQHRPLFLIKKECIGTTHLILIYEGKRADFMANIVNIRIDYTVNRKRTFSQT